MGWRTENGEEEGELKRETQSSEKKTIYFTTLSNYILFTFPPEGGLLSKVLYAEALPLDSNPYPLIC